MKGGNPVDRVVVGVLSGMTPKSNGWMRFEITEPGQQYPVKCETKQPDTIQAAVALMGQNVSAQIHEEDSGNANPHRPGTEYRNRYLNLIALAGEGAQSNAPPPQQGVTQSAGVQPQQTTAPQGDWNTITPQTKELHIMREHAMERVVDLVVGGKLPFEPQEVVKAAEVFVAYYEYGPARFGIQAFDTSAPGGGSEYHAGYAAQPGSVPADPSAAPVVNEDGIKVCEKCGYTEPHHAAGCPNEFAGL